MLSQILWMPCTVECVQFSELRCICKGGLCWNASNLALISRMIVGVHGGLKVLNTNGVTVYWALCNGLP